MRNSIESLTKIQKTFTDCLPFTHQAGEVTGKRHQIRQDFPFVNMLTVPDDFIATLLSKCLSIAPNMIFSIIFQVLRLEK